MFLDEVYDYVYMLSRVRRIKYSPDVYVQGLRDFYSYDVMRPANFETNKSNRIRDLPREFQRG